MLMTRRFQTAAWFVCLLLAISVSACGSDSKSKPTPSASTNAGPTVGELADRIAAAWSSVSTYRTVSRGQGGIVPGTAAAGTPNGSQSIEVVTEVVLPDRKHQISTLNGAVQEEFVVIGSTVYVRGPLTGGIAATPVADDWRVVDAATISPESTPASQIASLLAPIQPPYAGLSPDERDRDAKPLGAITVENRSCQSYQIVDTTVTGERIDVTLAIGTDNLPCSIETQVGGTDFLTTFTYNTPLTITSPVDFATPASS
jgi:hypothetical protein